VKVLVVGAGRTAGQQIVAQALEAGHEVTAFSPYPIPANGSPRGLHPLSGDLRDPAVIDDALAGQGAVLWAAGGLVLPGVPLSSAVRNLTAEMEHCGPRRLVFLSSLSAVESRLRSSLFSALFLMRLLRGPGLREGEAQERYVRQSKLQWTIVRPGTLADGPRTGRCQVGFGAADVPLDARISYADAADFMLEQITNPAYSCLTVEVFS
jgi:putative NADH-flavin reductase